MCEYCGLEGCHWTNHDEARRDAAAWQREALAQEFPFGDYKEGEE